MTENVIDYEPLIHAALMDRVEATAFPFVTYEQGRLTIGDQAGKPESAVAHALACDFVPSRNHRSRRFDRQEWQWKLELTFKGEVALGRFERDLLESPPRVLRDRDAGRDQQVTLILTGSAYQPPPEGQPASGMRATFRFNAQLTPS